MDTAIHDLLSAVLGTSNPAVVALLLLFSGLAGWLVIKQAGVARAERKELLASFQQQIEGDRKDLLQVIDKYQNGQMSVLQALNELKVLIATIGGKL